jgi:hypothetical protein
VADHPPAPPTPPPPPPAAPPSGSSGRSRTKIVVGVVVVAVLGIGGYLVLGRGGSSGPEQTVRDFITAGQHGDCEKIVDLRASAGFRRSAERADAIAHCRKDVESGDFHFDFGQVDKVELRHLDGNAAQVVVTSTVDGKPETRRVALLEDGGKWRIVHVD